MMELLERVLPLRGEPDRRSLAAARPGGFRDIGCGLLEKALDPRGPSDKGLARLIRKERRLGSKDRPVIVQTLYGVLRRRSLLETLLEGAGAEVTPVTLWQLELILSRGISPEGIGLPQILSEVDGCLGRWRERASPTAHQEIAALSSLPLWMVRRLASQEPEHEILSLCASLSEEPKTTLRVNTARTSSENLLLQLEEEGVEVWAGRFALEALVVQGRPNLRGTQAFKNGLFEVQDEASQLVAELVEPVRSGLVIDYCAGAGGKTLALASRLPRGGRLLAADVRESSLKEARRRLGRAGATRVSTHCLTGAALPVPPQSAARVLVDAPCTGLGRLRHQPVHKWRIQESRILVESRRQSEILREASQWVQPGGRLIYATCSLLREENEEVIAEFLRENPHWRQISVREILGRSRSKVFERGQFFRSYPHLHQTDGFAAGILVAPRQNTP
ncbi:MAG: RsmB/NOP family class I SAM-dependent RNA methyltransferase [Myxococcota bacterium]|nr:RsmB/NOP family class I SAM-dependent RNA methyltransferase [Myxococcota bacterium]